MTDNALKPLKLPAKMNPLHLLVDYLRYFVILGMLAQWFMVNCSDLAKNE
jgi:hypothetical protein